MRHPIRPICILAIFLLALTAATVPSRCETEIKVTKVAEDLYFLTGVVCNVAFLITEEGVLVVDSGTAHLTVTR